MNIYFTQIYVRRSYFGAILLLIALLAGCTPKTEASKTITQERDGVFAAALSRDGSLSLMSSASDDVTLWQLTPNAQIKFRWQQQSQNNVFLVKFSPEHRYAISASRHDFAIWSTQTGQSLGFYSIGQSVIRDIALSANGQNVVVGLENAKVVFINLRTGRRLEFLGHTQAINIVRLSANGRYAFSAGNGGDAILWNTQSAQIITKVHMNSRITQIAMTPDGKYIFVAGSHNQAKIYTIVQGQLLSKLAIHTRQEIFSSARFVNHDQWLLTGSANRKLRLWDVKTGQLLEQWKVGLNTKRRPASAVVYDATIDDNGQVISASSSGLVEYWSVHNE
ncbi:WD40 repeat domain-containing protein [Celerinatantimonas sp. MCCC 1A17872]|uniref:WD40 repeat domain-containing protein n=1 Tax=Celerinatantimonas sp. MCCC 1A17872 TaxID=3177514 RepID=UPI0038C2B2A7